MCQRFRSRSVFHRKLEFRVAIFDPVIGDRNLLTDGPTFSSFTVLFSDVRRGPFRALGVAVDEARLRRVVLAQILETLALTDDLRGPWQVILAERPRARLATEQDTTHRCSLAPTLVARVVRTLPSMVARDILHCDADAVRVDGYRAQIATHDLAAVPARLAHRAVAVVSASDLRARFL